MHICEYAVKTLKGLGETFEIGKSVAGRPILAAHFGSVGGKQLIITGGIHARECYTALVVLSQAEYSASHLNGGGAYFVPLVNPDGAAFFESGLNGTDGEEFRGTEFLYANRDKRLRWKSNALGVDLNCNFDANFGTGRLNVFSPSAAGYVGEYPLCAPESAALAAFTKMVMPDATVSYHCMGGELYWEFFQGSKRERDKRIASALAEHIGVKRVDGELGSAGGYKDWCVQKLGIPAFTVELLDRGEHPFRAEDFKAAAEINRDVPEYLLKLI